MLRRQLKKVSPFLSRLSRSLKVIGTDTDRSATYDFLLVFHSNYGLISYRLREIGNLPITVYLTPPLRGCLFKFCNGGGARKN